MSRAVTTVYLVDDEVLYRAALRAWFGAQPDYCVVGDASGAPRAVEAVRVLRPDIILLDVGMPGTSGIDALPTLLAAHAASRVIMLTNQTDHGVVRAAFAGGAAGFVDKAADQADLLIALSHVVAGRRYLSPTIPRVDKTDDLR